MTEQQAALPLHGQVHLHASRVGSERGLPALNENKNVRDNCLKVLLQGENHHLCQVVGRLSLPFSHHMGSPTKRGIKLIAAGC